MDYLIRFAEHSVKSGGRVFLQGNRLWTEYNRMVVPVGPCDLEGIITAEEGRALLQQFPSALLVRTSYPLDTARSPAGGWYSVICDKFEGISSCNAGDRAEIRKALRACTAVQIDAKTMASQGYSCYRNAFRRYHHTSNRVIDEGTFVRNIMVTEGYEDIIHYWGVYAGNDLIGYAINFIYGSIETNYSSVKIDPDYLKLRPADALVYTMNTFYLNDGNMRYVSDGYRSLAHGGGFQEYLERKFGFRKHFLGLQIVYRPWFGAVVSALYPVRQLIGEMSPRVAAVLELEGLRRDAIGMAGQNHAGGAK